MVGYIIILVLYTTVSIETIDRRVYFSLLWDTHYLRVTMYTR